MSFGINVQGGTHAGWKVQREKPQAWVCVPCEIETRKIGRTLPAYLVACPDCKKPRPR